MKRLGSVLCALAALVAVRASATAVIGVDVPELARTSDAVVRGTVKRVESKWSGDHMRIYTEVDVEVAEALKGSPAQTVTITQPGGVVGDIGQRVSGLASFQPGEEVVVFLERQAGERYVVSAMAQGKFRVERSSDGRTAFAVPDSTGDAMILDPTTRQPVPSKMKTVELSELRDVIRKAAANSPPPRRTHP